VDQAKAAAAEAVVGAKAAAAEAVGGAKAAAAEASGLVESLRPRGALELIDDAGSLLRRRWSDVSILAAVSLTPTIVLSVVMSMRSSTDGSLFTDPQLILQLGQSDRSTTQTIVALVLGSLSLATLIHALTRLVLNDLVGRVESPWRVLLLTFRSFHRWVGTWLLGRVALGLGLLLCGVGILWPWAVFWVLIPIAASERLTPIAAMRRCLELTKGARGRILGVALLLEVTTSLAQIALFLFPAQIVSGLIDGRPLSLVLALVGSGVAILIESITAATVVHAYLDLRVRREGLDLDLRLRGLT